MQSEARSGVSILLDEATLLLEAVGATAYALSRNLPTSKTLLPQAASAILSDATSKVVPST
jgi:hypothetical protein